MENGRSKHEIRYLKTYLERSHLEAYLAWQNVVNYIPGRGMEERKPILRGITSVAQPGEIVAIWCRKDFST